jgi:phage antirepressor YoqD-like protein
MTSLELVDFINADREGRVKAGELTKYVELAHRSLMAKVPEVLGAGCAKFIAHHQNEQNGQSYAIYCLPKREACLVAMSYSYALQAKVFDRMCELEQAVGAPRLPGVPQTFAQALRLAAEQAEVIEQQAAQLEAAKPAVEFVDRYCDATGALGFRQVAKVLKVKEHIFRDFLIEKKIMYRLGGALAPMAAHLDAGRFVVKAGHAASNNHAFNSARFTPKGVNWVAGEFAKHQVEQQLALH